MLHIRFAVPEEGGAEPLHTPPSIPCLIARNAKRGAQAVRRTKNAELHIRFAVPEEGGADTLAHASIDPGMLMKLIARNAKRGAQFTPQGILRWPLTSAKAEDVGALVASR